MPRDRDFFSGLKGKRVAAVTHAGADLDALCSAAALRFSLEKECVLSLVVPEHVNAGAKAFAEKMGIPYAVSPSLDAFDAVVCLDFNAAEMAGDLGDALTAFSGPVYVIDHHPPGQRVLGSPSTRVIDEEATSSSELVYGLLRAGGKPVGPRTATCIAAGILVDTAGFSVATPRAFRVMAEALEAAGKELAEIAQLFYVDTDVSEKVASLKAARRARIYNACGYIVATTNVDAFEASAASALVKCGADVAFAGGESKTAKGKTVLVSGRVNNLVTAATGFSLPAHVIKWLEKDFGGSGGGHPAAASYNGLNLETGVVLEKCLAHTLAFFQHLTGKKDGLREYK